MLTLTITVTPVGGPSEFNISFYDNTGSLLGSTSCQVSPGSLTNTVSTGTAPLPSGALYWTAELFQSSYSNPGTNATVRFQFQTPGCTTGALSTPCCPPDPLVDTYLAQIYATVTAILAQLPASIIGYVPNGAHPGLSGSGNFVTAAGTIALDVSITGTGPAQGQVLGDPVRWFNLGWVTPEIASVPYAPTRLEFLNRTILLPPLVDVVNYTLGSGVTAAITELKAA